MATTAAQKKEAESAADAPQRKHYAALRESMLKELEQLRPANPTPADRLPPQYIIRAGTPLPELNAGLARAFAAEDEKDPSRSLYALVCDPKVPVRGKVIKALTGVALPHLVPLVATGVTQVTGFQGRRLVMIYGRPKGKPLSAIIAERGGKSLPETFIIEHIIGPLGAVIDHLAEFGFSHGRVHPGNIFFGEQVMLGECASEPCGYSQPYLFEPPERAQATPAGKGEGTSAQDFYAIGALAAYLRLGQRLLDGSDTLEKHIYRILREGAYQGFAHNIDLSDAMTDLLRGTLNDNARERWTWQQLRLWTGGRRFNMLPPALTPAGSRPYYIDKNEYKNMRDLAQGLFDHWPLVARQLRDETVVRWVDMSVRRKDIAELLRKTIHSLGHQAHHGDEMVSRCLVILDPQGPLSMKDVRVHVDGVGAMLAEGYRTDMQQHVQHVVEIIEQGLANIWGDMRRRREEELPQDINNAMWQLDRLRLTLRQVGLGFGMERVLYDLAPDLSCQSPLLGGDHAHTLRDLLLTLDRLAPAKARDMQPIDRHIAAFIASKLNLSREVWLSEGNELGALAQHPALVALTLLEQAHENAGRPTLPALTAWISVGLLEAVESFHSKSVREHLEAGIKKLAARGQLPALRGFINQRAFLENDSKGFKQAVMRYRVVRIEIARLRNRQLTRRKAARSGYAAAKYIAYGILLCVVILQYLAGRFSL